MKYCLTLLMLAVAAVASAAEYDDVLSVSVRVEVGQGCGTGVLITRECQGHTRTFVWTAGHVVASMRQGSGFVNPVVYCEYRDKGRLIGQARLEAKVIAYSDPTNDEDLALLEILQDDWTPLTRSATFYLSDDIPEIGAPLIHVGCTLGLYDSLSLGHLSQTERCIEGKIFDQTTCMSYPGSSGGGVYLQASHECIGLLTQGSGPGMNFIVPMRRIIPWAKQTGVMWALDPSLPVPKVRVLAPLASVQPRASIITVIREEAMKRLGRLVRDYLCCEA